MTHFTPHQQAAIESDAACIRVVAGPGSGKTRTLLGRISYLIGLGTPPDLMCVVTYTRAAARELQNGIPEQLGYCGTLHGLCARLIQEPFTLIDEETSETMWKDCMRMLRLTFPEKEMRKLKSHPSARYRTNTGLPSDQRALHTEYHGRLASNRMEDYNTLLWRGTDAARHAQFTHLFVDEIQDANEIDYAIYEAMPATHRFYVGDPDQAIFEWRGAHPHGFIFLGGFKTFPLEDNFRSDALICGAADRLISHNNNRLVKINSPVSNEPGQVFINNYSDSTFEREGVLLDAMLHQSSAVLLRTNRQVDRYLEQAEEMHIPVAKRAEPTYPPDWAIARLAVQLSTSPNNEWLAQQLLTKLHGPEHAAALIRDSAIALRSLNDTYIGAPQASTAGDAAQFARAWAPQSIDLLNEVLGTVGAHAPPNELCVAMFELGLDTRFDGNGLTICTIHSAKGCEWDNVYLPGWNHGEFPLGKNIEEERRLAFVGITRARHAVHISWTRRRISWGEELEGQPSVFIQDLE